MGIVVRRGAQSPDHDGGAARQGLLESLPPPARALDVATGTGRWALHLARRGAEVVAVDQSPEMLAVARGKAHSQGLTVTLVEGALEDGLPFASGSFDLVMCALALNHVPDLTGAIRDCCRVLRSRGHLIITDFHPQAIENGWETTLFRGEDAYILPNPKHSRDGYLEAIAAGSCDILHVEEVLVREQPRESIVAPDYDAFMDQYGDWPFCLIILARRRAESS